MSYLPRTGATAKAPRIWSHYCRSLCLERPLQRGEWRGKNKVRRGSLPLRADTHSTVIFHRHQVVFLIRVPIQNLWQPIQPASPVIRLPMVFACPWKPGTASQCHHQQPPGQRQGFTSQTVLLLDGYVVKARENFMDQQGNKSVIKIPSVLLIRHLQSWKRIDSRDLAMKSSRRQPSWRWLLPVSTWTYYWWE